MKHYVMLSVISCISFSSSAAWFEAAGQARIEQGNTTQARQSAIDDAVKRAALAAGARISSTQQLIDGVLQAGQLDISSHGEIKQLQLMSEQRNGDLLTVTLRVDIEAEPTSCNGIRYRKPMLLSKIRLQARQDAIYGQLFQLGNDATVQLERHLRDYSPATLVSVAPQSIEQAQLVYPDNDRLFQSGQQYVLSATINDLSLGQQTNSFWQADEKERFFALNVQLFDLFEQTLIYQQEYRTSAGWPFKRNDTPASHSQAFWQLPYGSKIDRLLQAVAEDVQQQLQCQPLLGNIRQVNHNQIMLALGENHGLQQGDTLQLIQLQRHPTAPGVKRLLQDPLQLTITDLNSQYAWASSSKAELLQHIRPGDVVTVQKSPRY